jgi:hypothetical protein
MGRYALAFLVIGAALLAAGCAKGEAPARPAAVTVEAAAGGAAEAAAVPAPAPAAGYGYPLRVGMWLYVFDDGKDTGAPTDVTRASESLPLGEKLTVIAAEPRRATNPFDGDPYDYYRVRRDTGKEGLVFANQLSLGSELAVVAEERANLYRSAKNVDVTDYILPRRIVLGVFPETERDGFIRIEAYDPASRMYRRNMFIKTAALSFSEQDVQSSILLQTAEALDPEKEKNRREALLDSALYDYPDSIFAGEIRALAGNRAPVQVRDWPGQLRVIDDNVNVRESPSAASRVVTQLSDTVEVHAVEQTVDQFTIDGQTARWFHIVQPVEGWVFGAWLEDVSR